MAVTLSELESIPTTWPEIEPYPDRYNPDDDLTIHPEVIWKIIERWITTRWTARDVVFVVEGSGEWQSRLSPFHIVKTEIFSHFEWIECGLYPSPLGGVTLPDEGPFRITGVAGDDSPVPEDAREAYRRLHGFHFSLAEKSRREGSFHLAFHKQGDESEAPVAYAGKSLRLSGAADLLRPYRRIR